MTGRRALLAGALFVWALGYAVYRGYYALGGEAGMIGVPRSDSEFQRVNAIGAGIVLLGALVPLVLVAVERLRSVASVLGWVAGVGCTMHALVDATLRVLSLAGVHPTELPASFWASFDRRTADLQDLFLNEPWFLVEGLLWIALGLGSTRESRRRPWLVTAAVACAGLTAVGILSGLDVIGSVVVD
ncbi:hypothetical protein [Aeromicrobium terrae]|uniref:DUF3995 domain-containing protein n=1 Tax=Aeromicrobium terrae TaxID=2498846 RepID=A0A5C8NNP4_9ACTN|nr:hypothetical protein [Aeromicrobium terrae]TXL62093.1 hypothetical protein FHP06_05115 [Aeromicrobium terrae]